MYFDKKTFGSRVAELRKNRSISRDRLAEKLHVSRSTLYSIEVGNRQPGVQLVESIICFFDVPIEYFLVGEKMPEYEVQKMARTVLSNYKDSGYSDKILIAVEDLNRIIQECSNDKDR